MTLIPEQRPDKNGHLVTRWVKPEGSSTSVSAIPPVAASSVLPFDATEYITELLSFWDEQASVDTDKDVVTANIWELQDKTLLAIDIDYQLDSGDGERMGAIFEWIEAFGEKDEVFLRELVTFAGAFEPAQSVSFIESSLTLLKKSGALPLHEDYSQAAEPLKQSIRNIIGVTEAAYGEIHYQIGDSITPKLPDDLIALIMERPDEAGTIKQIVEDRGTVDTDLIRSILKSAAPAVNDGVL